MPAALDLNTPSQPLRAVFQSLVGERDEARQEAESQRRRLTLEIKLLKERIRLLLLSKYGSTSEQLCDAQLSLLELEPGVTREEVATEAVQPAREKQLRRQAAPHGRSPLPAHLPRVEEFIPVPDDERHCATCGCAKCSLGHDVTEVLDLKPGELFVRVIQREKLACPRHPEAGVAMGPSPARIIPGGKFSDAFIIAAVLKKYLEHLPLYRQSEAWWRDAQVDVSRSVLGDAIMAVGALLLPVNAAQRLELLARDYLQVDETPGGRAKPQRPQGPEPPGVAMAV